jgi:CheY-like chemotaxis protein
MKQNKILIVEDQRNCVEALEYAVNSVSPGFFPDFQKGDFDIARCYQEAEEKIQGNAYGVVLLDNRMPYENQVELEKKDFDGFCATLENIGYSLIPKIKERNPKTVVIGTSSLSGEELGRFPEPDFSMRKRFEESKTDLEGIFRQVNGGNE